ncbi:Neuroblastoma-amplified sequence [Vanrija pseudolonga]|uniref:Neuroblastoma-amplified sequence n=1 Tax=Vanrija pseudolonga TaxID=143232 RepID=A0AAF0Y266_9TREE|nr:Neuroblastoma-amplified sequence [Vanrija pseudolonga]
MESPQDAPVASSSSAQVLGPDELLATPSSKLSLGLITSSLDSLGPSTRLVTCANLVLGGKILDQATLRRVIQLGLDAGEEEATLLEDDVRSRLENTSKTGDGWEGWSRDDVRTQLHAALGTDAIRLLVARCLAILQDARRRLDTYDVFAPPRRRKEPSSTSQHTESTLDLDDPWADNDDEEDEDVPAILDDPWADGDEDDDMNANEAEETPEAEAPEPPIDVPSFILQPLPLTVLYLASSASIAAVRAVCERHAQDLWPYRISIVEAVPAWVSPADENMLALLPGASDDGAEQPWPRKKTDEGKTFLDYLTGEYGLSALTSSPAELLPGPQNTQLSGDALTQWYTDRVFELDGLGLLDGQLAWVQHGAALGVPGLDAIGEDLSLLSRLIYDANLSPAQLEQWSLVRWRDADEKALVKEYLAASTPDSIVGDIRRLVLPYLYVLESRAERAGTPDPGLVDRMLHETILELPLHLALPCFEASKATLRAPQRLVKDDQMVARLALACLYGSDQRDSWSTMSAIFECLPVWDVSGSDPESDREATATTLDSIASFIRPTVSNAGPHSPKELFIFFSPLPFASLSRALDILDVHLESGEILARWDVRVQLRTLLQSAKDHDEQVMLAEKMGRRLASAGGGDDRRWVALWEDMLKLQRGNDSLLRGALGTLTPEELMRIFLGSLLLSGNVGVARKVIQRLQPEGYFTPQTLEDVVLTTSKELYMRAETGNIHTGDMKLAYECLSVAPESPAIRAEQDFIQATSRLSTYRSLSNLSPAEIRYTPNKLDLIRRVLSTSDDAYRHPHIVLELAEKLGIKDEAARAEILAMMADAAVAAEDWTLAQQRVDEMVALAKPDLGDSDAAAQRTRDVVWRSCFELGRQSEYGDVVGRQALLAQAMLLCPAEHVSVILPIYRGIEAQIAAHPEVLRRAGSSTASTSAPSPTAEERVLGSRTAARAARMALDIGASFRNYTGSPALPSGRSDLSRWDSRGSHGSKDGRDAAALFDRHADGGNEGVREGAKRALVKGVGWLLGADESEIVG